MKLWNKFKQSFHRAADTVDRYQTASTYSQAGAQEQALEMLRREPPQQEHPPKLLVLTQGPQFPADMREYALNMAKRLGYEMIAMNTAPIKREAVQFLDQEYQHLRDAFQSEAENGFAAFQAEAEEQGVHVEHLIKFLDKEEALEEIRSERSHIDFVISDSEEVQHKRKRTENHLRPGREICVYSI
jgi:hypothetical protein